MYVRSSPLSVIYSFVYFIRLRLSHSRHLFFVYDTISPCTSPVHDETKPSRFLPERLLHSKLDSEFPVNTRLEPPPHGVRLPCRYVSETSPLPTEKIPVSPPGHRPLVTRSPSWVLYSTISSDTPEQPIPFPKPKVRFIRSSDAFSKFVHSLNIKNL